MSIGGIVWVCWEMAAHRAHGVGVMWMQFWFTLLLTGDCFTCEPARVAEVPWTLYSTSACHVQREDRWPYPLLVFGHAFPAYENRGRARRMWILSSLPCVCGFFHIYHMIRRWCEYCAHGPLQREPRSMIMKHARLAWRCTSVGHKTYGSSWTGAGELNRWQRESPGCKAAVPCWACHNEWPITSHHASGCCASCAAEPSCILPPASLTPKQPWHGSQFAHRFDRR